MKKVAFIFAGVAMASLALAQLSKHKDWAKSPEAYFLTPAEKQEWSAVKSDEEAEKFIALYWTRRDPNPATAANEFRDGVMRRIAAADEQFKSRRYPKGSESPRGRVLVALGAPSRATRSRGPDALPSGASVGGIPTGPDTGVGVISGDQSSSAVTMTWTYDKSHFDPSWGIGELRVQFTVDPARGTDEMAKDAALERAITVVAEKTIVSPSGTVASPVAPGAVAPSKPAVPPAATGPGAASAAPPPPPPAPAAATIPAASRSVLEALVKEKKDAANPAFWGGSFHAITGDGFYAVELYVPADRAPATTLKFGGVVTSESGQEVSTFWEDAALTEMKTGSRADKVFERSVVVAPGSYRGAFGLFTVEGGTPIVSAASSFKIEVKPTDFALSPLILTNTLTPLTKRPGPTDPFVFGMEKPIKVEPKGNRLFAKEDSLWYFYTVWNPKLPAASAEATAPKEAAAASPAPTPAPSTTPGAAATAPAASEAPKPRIQARIGVLKDGQPAFAPFTGPAEMQMLAPGYYATGSEIPLATFEPGYYTFALTVRDLGAPRDSAAFKGIDRKEDFVVLKPDGSMPEKAAPAKPAAPKPKPKK